MGDRCERCEQPLDPPRSSVFRCAECGALQAPDPARDHFRSFGFARDFDLDVEELERRHLRLSRDLHPDHAGADTQARTRAVLHSAQVNEAYAVLRDPFRRADYLLGLEGGPKASEDRSVPGGFLEQMMELRADLEDVLEDAARQATFREMLQEHLRTQLKVVAERLADRNLREARQALNVAAYYRGMLRDLKDALAARG